MVLEAILSGVCMRILMSNYFCRKAVLQFFPGNFSEQEKKNTCRQMNGKFHN